MNIKQANNHGSKQSAKGDISELMRKGNLAQAEILLRIFLERNPNNPEALYLLGKIAADVNQPHFALQYFNEAVKYSPGWDLPQLSRDRIREYLASSQGQSEITPPRSDFSERTERFLLIKAWGFGFWSDVSHVLGQLLVAELTGRIPVVHWGNNSLFGDGTATNAFEFYFEAISKIDITDLQKRNYDFWPPKWNPDNLMEGEVNKWKGPYSRIAGLYELGRKETVVVSDFFANVIDLKPWIPMRHPLYGLSIDELWRYLIRKYLHPKREIMDTVNGFCEKYNLSSGNFMAVHIRGSDKIQELANLEEVNMQYESIIDRCLSTYDFQYIFLMTDDMRLLDRFKQTYGSKIIHTECQRTRGSKGVHYLADSDKRRLGTEVMVDVYLASQAKVFIGNGYSNPSQFVCYLKDWPDGTLHLVGPNIFHKPNLSIRD